MILQRSHASDREDKLSQTFEQMNQMLAANVQSNPKYRITV